MLTRDGRLRVAVRPSFFPGASGVSGGIENYVQGLASGLSALDGEDRYEFVGTGLQRDALAPYLGGATSFVTIPDALRSSQVLVRFMATRPGRAVVALRQKARARSSATPAPSPEVVEQDTYSVVHYPAPSGELTSHPSIYQPWDLQHLHFPEFFRPEQLRGREVWRICSERATYVLVASTFVRDDVIAAYDVEPDRVAVVPPGVPSALHATPPNAGLGDVPFALYPAQSWKHKNHVRMLEATALLKARGTEVPVVCPGPPNPHQREVERRAHDLGLDSVVRFPGYVTDRELAALYQQARCLVFPSLFEGFGFPVLEAFAAGLPVTCSSTTSLPELAGDAAVLFDPTDVEAMAAAIERIWTDDALRADLVVRGHQRAATYTWDHLARSCRALYRAAARQSVDATDAMLLAAAGVSS